MSESLVGDKHLTAIQVVHVPVTYSRLVVYLWRAKIPDENFAFLRFGQGVLRRLSTTMQAIHHPMKPLRSVAYSELVTVLNGCLPELKFGCRVPTKLLTTMETIHPPMKSAYLQLAIGLHLCLSQPRMMYSVPKKSSMAMQNSRVLRAASEQAEDHFEDQLLWVQQRRQIQIVDRTGGGFSISHVPLPWYQQWNWEKLVQGHVDD